MAGQCLPLLSVPLSSGNNRGWSPGAVRCLPSSAPRLALHRARRPDVLLDRASTRAPSREEATMEEHLVWMTTRQIKPGTLSGFERAWRPDTHPAGTLRAYAYWSPMSGKSSGSRSGPRGSCARRGAPRAQRPADGRRWPPTSLASRSASTAAASSTRPALATTPGRERIADDRVRSCPGQTRACTLLPSETN